VFALFRMLRWQVDKWLRKKKECIYTFWNNRKVICFADSQTSMWAVYYYVMDWNEFNFIKFYLKEADCAFDVGANVGMYTLWISRFIKNGKIVCFEPDPTNYNRCRRQIEINKLDIITLERAALGANKGEMRFSQGKDEQNHLIQCEKDKESDITVSVMKLDDYCCQNEIKEIDYLKLDVEGAELLVLRGALEFLSQKRIKVIQFELTNRIEQFGFRKNDLIEFIETLNYTICLYNIEKNLLYPVVSDSDYRQNMFAVSEVELVNTRLSQLANE